MSKKKKKKPHVRLPGTKPQNYMLAKIEATADLKYEFKFNRRMDIAFQMAMDAAMIAANELFNMGPGRAPRFRDLYNTALSEMADLMNADGYKHNDKELVFSRAKIDERIKRIVGEENFVPWDDRYAPH